MTNLRSIIVFTESLKELTDEKLTLYQSLRIIGSSRITDKKIRHCAEYLSEAIEKGIYFSNALRTCPFIKFDSVYISFVSFAERDGGLSEILGFLLDRSKRIDENRNSLAGALIYPLFVVFLVLGLSILFLFSGKLFPEGNIFSGINQKDLFETVVFSFLTFALIGTFLICILLRFLGEDKLYEAFLAGGFLSEKGTGLSQACGMAALILGSDSSFGKVFLKAREGLEYGMDLRSAFSREGNERLQKKIEMALLMAEETGNKDEVLMKIAKSLKKENERYRKYCLTLVEPAFIVLTGVFLLGIVINLVLPVFSETGIL